MTAQRLPSLPALVLLTACATSGVTPRSVLVPRNGPNARITASYMGGMTARSLRSSFSVDKASYVMVGHLAGDGRIRILYPEHPKVSNRVEPRKQYAVRSASAQYDAVPQLYSFASRAYRSVSARMDSYDGRGNGYVFIVASAHPLDLTDLATDGVFDEYEVEDYTSTSDPRYAINELAEHVTRGVPYTLDYADSFTTNANYSYAQGVVDCGMLYGMLDHFMSSGSLWGGGGFFVPSHNGVGWQMNGLSVGGGNVLSFYRPRISSTFGYNGFIGSGGCGHSDYGPWFNTAMFLPPKEYPGWGYTPSITPVDSPTTLPGLPVVPAWGGGRDGRPGFGIGVGAGADTGESSELKALSRSRYAGSPSGSLSTPRSREVETFKANRPMFDIAPRTRADKPSHNGADRGANGPALDSGNGFPTRLVDIPRATAGSTTGSSASNPAPSEPPPKVEVIRRPPQF